MGDRPGVILTSRLTDDIFEWMSDGWYSEDKRGQPYADALFAKANKCIEDATDAPDAIDRLTEAGFIVVLG